MFRSEINFNTAGHRRHSHRLTRLLCAISLAVASGAPAAHAAGVVGGGTPASCTIDSFNTALVGGGSVTFNCGPNPFTLTLDAQKTISFDTRINGADLITLKASNSNHFMVRSRRTTLALENITLTGGVASVGGAIDNSGTTSLLNVTFADNTATDKGGAIRNFGALSARNCTFNQNKANNGGGAVFNDGGSLSFEASKFDQNQGDTAPVLTGSGGAINNLKGTLILANCTFTNNSAAQGGALHNVAEATIGLSTFTGNKTGGNGGAITNLGTLTVDRSTFVRNQGGSGGAIAHLIGRLSLNASTFNANISTNNGGGVDARTDASYTNCTFSGNQAEITGGGIYQQEGMGLVRFTTITENSAGVAGGGVFKVPALPGNLSVQNTLLAKNRGSDCEGRITTLGNNLATDPRCPFTAPGDKIVADAKLDPLANNGGPTMTHLPQTGSPAINAAVMVNGITTDQRGITRPQGSLPDIGSVEVP